jgi:hypothetical protein
MAITGWREFPAFAGLAALSVDARDPALRCGDGLTASPPAEKATTRKDQAGKSSAPKAKRAGYRMASTLSRRPNLRGQTICWRRRRTKARRAPQAAARPGNPAPTIGPGTVETAVSSSSLATA